MKTKKNPILLSLSHSEIAFLGCPKLSKSRSSGFGWCWSFLWHVVICLCFLWHTSLLLPSVLYISQVKLKLLIYLVNKEVQRSKDNIAELIERLCNANLSLVNQQVPRERRASWVPYGRKHHFFPWQTWYSFSDYWQFQGQDGGWSFYWQKHNKKTRIRWFHFPGYLLPICGSVTLSS